MNKEISAVEAAALKKQNPEVAFLDVREDIELKVCRIEGALHIPMGEVPERFEALPKQAPLIVLCHHGMRSAQVVQFLEAKGFDNAINLGGGINAWAIQVDPSMSRY